MPNYRAEFASELLCNPAGDLPHVRREYDRRTRSLSYDLRMYDELQVFRLPSFWLAGEGFREVVGSPEKFSEGFGAVVVNPRDDHQHTPRFGVKNAGGESVILGMGSVDCRKCPPGAIRRSLLTNHAFPVLLFNQEAILVGEGSSK